MTLRRLLVFTATLCCAYATVMFALQLRFKN
jgi:hypothetical protein